MRDNLRKKPRFCQEAATEQLLHAIAKVSLAHSGYRCVDGDNQTRETCGSCAVYRAFGGHSPAQQVELVEDWSAGTCFDVLQRVSRNGGENVGGACETGSSRGGDFATGMHQAAVAYGRQQGRKR